MAIRNSSTLSIPPHLCAPSLPPLPPNAPPRMASPFSYPLPTNLKPTAILADPARPRLYSSSLTFISTISRSNHKKVGRAPCFKGTPTPTKKKTTTRKKRQPPSPKPKTKPIPSFFSDGKDPLEDRPICPGCGVFMQDKDPNLPGYYQKKEEKSTEDDEDDDGSLPKSALDEDFTIEDDEEPLEEDEEEDEDEDEEEDVEEGEDIDWDSVEVVEGKSGRKRIGFDVEDFFDDEDEDEDEERRWRKELDGFGPAGVGYGGVTEETLKGMQREKLSKSERRKKAREEARKAMEDDGAVVCARCHSLRHHGQIKNQKADNLIPDFDFDRLVVASLMKPASTSPVVVMVVDCADFDGSFPKNAVKSLFKALDAGDKRYVKLSKSPRLVLVATKVDLLPSQVSPARLDRWVRNRAKAWGAPKLSGVYLASAHKDLGVRNLLAFVKELSGPRSNVWVIGAQNAGKSTLINAFAKKEGVKASRLTEAAVPGTTLGIIRIGNVLPAKAKMYDTPGLLHPYLMSMWLNREEQKMVEIRKELQPRSYRVKAGQTVHLGGLARLDVTRTSVETIYVTVWASQSVSLHLGKTENANEIWNTHVGVRLQPPIGQDRPSELGQWRQKEMKVKGDSWEVNSLDIAISGLGWFSLGLKGQATVVLWTLEGVEITKRDPLVLDRAQFLERPGFLLPKAISDAIGNQSKRVAEAKKKAQPGDFLLEV